MLKRLALSSTLGAATATIFKLYDNTDNPTYDDTDGSAPTAGSTGDDFLLGGLYLSASAQVSVEVGLTNTDKSAFTPAFRVELSGTNGPAAFSFPTDRPLLSFTHATINLLAVRLTSIAGGATLVSGGIDILAR